MDKVFLRKKVQIGSHLNFPCNSREPAHFNDDVVPRQDVSVGFLGISACIIRLNHPSPETPKSGGKKIIKRQDR
jgi:hypothetical protein